MDEKGTALKIYERGLKFVPKTDERYEVCAYHIAASSQHLLLRMQDDPKCIGTYADCQTLQLLRRQRDSLSSALRPPTAVDPISVLPYEVIEMVLDYLPFSQLW